MAIEQEAVFDPAALDPGIRAVVLYLRGKGYETTDSGDGVSKTAFHDPLPFPHVVCRHNGTTSRADALNLKLVLQEGGFDGWDVDASYSTADDIAILFASKQEAN